MKIRVGFVSNSSSCSFIVTNKTNQDLDYSELVRDLKDVIDEYLKIYSWGEPKYLSDKGHETLIQNAQKHTFKYTFHANCQITVQFGDNAGKFQGIVGSAVDYIIRDKDFESDRFHIKFEEMMH